MSRRATIWILVFAALMFVASMALPVRSIDDDRYVAGFALAYLSVVGLFFVVPVCFIGALGNIGFLVGVTVGLVRACGRIGSGGSWLFNWACIVWSAMLISWIWTGVEMGRGNSLLERLMTLGGVAWVLSGGLLVWGCWGLRTSGLQIEPMGFEVIPVARRADEAP